MRIFCRSKFRVHKRSRLLNRCIQVDYKVANTFTRIVEIDIIANRCKVCDLVEKLSQAMSERVRDNLALKIAELSSSLT